MLHGSLWSLCQWIHTLLALPNSHSRNIFHVSPASADIASVGQFEGLIWNKVQNLSGLLLNDKYSYFIHVLPIFPWIRDFPYKFPGKTQLWSLFNRLRWILPFQTWPGLGEYEKKIPFQIHFSRQNSDLKESLGRRAVLKVVLQGFRDKIHPHVETQEGSWHIQKEGGVSFPAEFLVDRQELVVCLDLFPCWPFPAPVSSESTGFIRSDRKSGL